MIRKVHKQMYKLLKIKFPSGEVHAVVIISSHVTKNLIPEPLRNPHRLIWAIPNPIEKTIAILFEWVYARLNKKKRDKDKKVKKLFIRLDSLSSEEYEKLISSLKVDKVEDNK